MQLETDKQRILDMLQAEYEFVHRTIDNLSPEVMSIPNVAGIWSIKDTIAHLTAWMRRLIGWFAEIANGHAPDVPEKGYTWDDTDELNAIQYAADKNRSLDEVLADFHNSYHELYALLEALSEEDLLESTFEGLIGEPMWRLVKYNSYRHFQEHIRPIRQWLAQNR